LKETSDPPLDDGRAALDADALMKRVERLHRSIRRDSGESAVELYHRAALTRRVSVLGGGKAFTTRHGYDEGIALRATSREWDGLSFAASSGSSRSSLRWALDRCRDPGSRLPQKWMWARDGAGPLFDGDGEPRLPPLADVEAWLDGAREALSADCSSRPRPLELSVEVTVTVESWFADGGLRASRTRTRGWAMMRMQEPWVGDRASKPILVARRRWEDLPPEAWRLALEDRRLPDRPEESPPTASISVLFSPECSALLVLALVKALNAAGVDREITVGSAWRVTDDPGHHEALFGGSFDDAGFATHRTRLADGRRTRSRIEGRGHFRRPSFRDPPSPMPSQLVVSETRRDTPDRCVVATSLDLHPLAPHRWVLRIDGARLERGHPEAVLRPSFVSVSPRDLVSRCVATVGPPRLSHLGVETPALIFDNLPLQT
jgi:hypothetical protein